MSLGLASDRAGSITLIRMDFGKALVARITTGAHDPAPAFEVTLKR